MRRIGSLFLALLLVVACSSTVDQTEQTLKLGSAQPGGMLPTMIATRPAPSLTPTHLPTPTNTTPTATLPASPTPSPDPVAQYEQFTIEGLRARSYGGRQFEVLQVLSKTSQFTRELFSYRSDGLRITGQLTRPNGHGPFPVIILNHGYFPLAIYRTGYDTQHASDYLAARGYLCLAPDFRSHAGSDQAPNLFRAGHVIDTLNLIPLAQQLPEAKPGKIGMWGHSNGGEITTKALLISDQIAAALIYAPASPKLADNYYAFHHDQQSGDPNNTADFPLTPEQAPDLYEHMSPINYLRYVQTPVQIHYGTADVPVPQAWVDALHQGLLAAGKQSELFLYEGGTHSLQEDHKQLYLERTAAFFDQHLR